MIAEDIAASGFRKLSEVVTNKQREIVGESKVIESRFDGPQAFVAKCPSKIILSLWNQL